MSIDRVRAHIAKYGLEDRIQLFEESSATVLLAAERLGVEPARIAKTLSFLTEDGPVLILTAGDRKIDNPKYKAVFHTKAKMIPRDQVEMLIGHEVGGVCPFGVRTGVGFGVGRGVRTGVGFGVGTGVLAAVGTGVGVGAGFLRAQPPSRRLISRSTSAVILTAPRIRLRSSIAVPHIRASNARKTIIVPKQRSVPCRAE